jgi:hypothetical protein
MTGIEALLKLLLSSMLIGRLIVERTSSNPQRASRAPIVVWVDLSDDIPLSTMYAVVWPHILYTILRCPLGLINIRVADFAVILTTT